METRTRKNLLEQFGRIIADHAASGTFGAAAPVRVRGICGPRAGALEVWGGAAAGMMLRALSRDDSALLRNLVPWDFGRNRPNAFMSGRYLRLDAPWPDGMAETDIPLSSLGQHPDGDGRWIAGKNEFGDTITVGFNLDRTPHWLFSGTTGSGKTVCVHSALTQLARDDRNAFVLVDGKLGKSLRRLERLHGRAGPLATEAEQWKNALLWANVEMNRRFEAGGEYMRLIIVVEEVQEVIQEPTCAEVITRLVSLGREVDVHCLLTTQHPTVKALGGPRVARNLSGRMALKVTDDVASRVAVGNSTPRADYLLGRGDGYAVSVDAIHRAQMAYVVDNEVALVCGGDAALPSWPAQSGSDMGIAPNPPHRQADAPLGAEIGAAVTAAALQMGIRRFKALLAETAGHAPGTSKAKRLLALGRESLEWMEERGVVVDATTFDDDAIEDDVNFGDVTESSVTESPIYTGFDDDDGYEDGDD
ncbi:MAG: hypothetical protein JXR84_15260 [Anaerolineae bacterium]|nr:hypothetical protein [Anaerolineae bacterium]